MTNNQQSMIDENLFEHIYVSAHRMQRIREAMALGKAKKERVSQLGKKINFHFLNNENEPKLSFSFFESKPCIFNFI
jgi:hypothetical protein